MHTIIRMTKLNETTTSLLEVGKTLDTAFFKVLSEPARIDLIKHLLKLQKADVGKIASMMSQDRSVVSRHLKAMLQAGLVSCEKEGKYCSYSLNGDAFVEKLEGILSIVKKATSSNCC
jgi:DNA-binding transcriptional ArsR family regulator